MYRKNKNLKKHIPNFLTIIRILLVPVFAILMTSGIKNAYTYSLLILLIACFTDYLDGKLARKFNAVSKFGLFMDPLADKLLVLATFIIFLQIDILSNIVLPWMVILIFLRDFFVTILRSFMKKYDISMVTSNISKFKTSVQMVMIILLLILLIFESTLMANNVFFALKTFMILLTLFTVYTGIDYYRKNIYLLLQKMK
ncbi:MAG: CDP-diacylglycerol--glycerol-3-phosphate 3-phosphatidyltransferase [bacterium TMED161]|nr:CDP-diacylglycerol--glycerol-3-phosphate 3-phosphatidyltransferase [Candidatus Neomarinimicrobiota bacterium]OUW21544.1 MAG: CDP-diacylglycerol--glycerol-3-phosphate 3-phosphatidyltransferase [bacterium TMED161]